MIIGICGNSGCGKSTFADELVKFSNGRAIRYDIDTLGHDILLLDSVKEDISNEFGEELIVNGYVDRKKLSKIVFNDPKEMDKLTEITWKHMELEIDNFIKSNKDKTIILDWLLLPKTKFFDMCDIKILLDIPYDIRMNRAMLRDHITEEEFALREKAAYKYNKKDFTYVVNINNYLEIEEKVKNII